MEILIPVFTVDFALATLLALAGGFMFGFAGFGGGLIMTPLLALIYWPTESVIIANAIPILAAWQAVPGIWRYIRWTEVAPLLITCLIATPVGVYFLLVGDPEFIRRLMGGVVLFAAVSMLLGWTYNGPRNRAASVVAGIVGGGMNGYVGLGGPFVSLYFISAPVRSNVQRANMNPPAINVIILTLSGVITLELLGRATVLFVPFAFTIWLGTQAFRITTGPAFRRIVLGLVMAIAVSTIVA